MDTRFKPGLDLTSDISKQHNKGKRLLRSFHYCFYAHSLMLVLTSMFMSHAHFTAFLCFFFVSLFQLVCGSLVKTGL